MCCRCRRTCRGRWWSTCKARGVAPDLQQWEGTARGMGLEAEGHLLGPSLSLAFKVPPQGGRKVLGWGGHRGSPSSFIPSEAPRTGFPMPDCPPLCRKRRVPTEAEADQGTRPQEAQVQDACQVGPCWTTAPALALKPCLARGSRGSLDRAVLTALSPPGGAGESGQPTGGGHAAGAG